MTTVKTFDSTMSGAPVLSGTAGALINVVKTCLVDGFGAGAVQALSVAGGVATATYATSHPFRVGSVALIAGATPAALNGQKLVLSTTSTTITFDATGVADGAASGSITSQLASAGWSQVFSGTNLSALKPSVVEATGCVLRINDAGTTNARVRAFESMSDINTGLGPTPMDSQVNGGLWWPKSNAASSAARPWVLVADARGFYLGVDVQGTGRFTLLFAGDIASLKSGDAYGYLITGNQADQVNISAVPDGCCGWSHRSARGGAYLVRAHTGIGQAIAAQRIGAHHNGTTADVYSGTAGYGFGSYPNGANNGLMVGALEVFGTGIRGTLPGLWHAVQAMEGVFSSLGFVDGTDDLQGRRLMALRTAPPAGSVTPGTVWLDTTGPWSR